MVTAKSIAASLAISISTLHVNQSHSANYLYPSHDVVINVATHFMDKVFDNFINANFGLQYHNNGAICSNPRISFSISQARIERRSTLKPLAAPNQAVTSIGANIVIPYEVSHCVGSTIAGMVRCQGELPILSMPRDNALPARCRINISGIPVMHYDVPFSIPNPIMLPEAVVIELPGPSQSGDIAIDTQFATFENGRFVADQGEKAKRRRWTSSGYALWTDPILLPGYTDGRPVQFVGNNLVVGATFGHSPALNVTSSYRDFINGFRQGSTFFRDPYAFALIRVRSTAIAPERFPSDPRVQQYGLLGGWFPLLLSAHLKNDAAGTNIKASLVISSSMARIETTSGSSRFVLGVRIEQLEVSDGITNAPLPAILLQPQIEISQPFIDSRGKIRFDVKSLYISIQIDNNGTKIELPVGDLVAKLINDGLPDIARIDPSLRVNIPDCLDSGNPRVISERPCPQLGNRMDELISRRSADVPSEIRINLAATKFSFNQDVFEIQISVPKESP